MDRPQWTLRTARTNYVISLTADARSVVLDHWGAPLARVPRYGQPQRVLSHVTETDVLPLEYASDGQRHGVHRVARRSRRRGYGGDLDLRPLSAGEDGCRRR